MHRRLVTQARRDVWQTMFDHARTLRDARTSLIDIVRETGLNWRTVERWARLATLPPRRITAPTISSPANCQACLKRR